MEEVWKPIEGFPQYEVSNMGKVKGPHGFIGCKSGRHNHVSLGRKRRTRIYKLVAEAFVPNPNNYTEIRHKDGNTANDAASNLEWVPIGFGKVPQGEKRVPLEDEEWRDVVGYEELYQVSNMGRVYSKQHDILMKPTYRNGYHAICIKHKPKPVHRLVAMAFLPNPDNLPIINHKDENRANNNVSNLEWCTYLHNNTWNGVMERGHQKQRHKVGRFSADGKLIDRYDSIQEAARCLGVRDSTIIRWLRGDVKPSKDIILKRI